MPLAGGTDGPGASMLGIKARRARNFLLARGIILIISVDASEITN